MDSKQELDTLISKLLKLFEDKCFERYFTTDETPYYSLELDTIRRLRKQRWHKFDKIRRDLNELAELKRNLPTSSQLTYITAKLRDWPKGDIDKYIAAVNNNIPNSTFKSVHKDLLKSMEKYQKVVVDRKTISDKLSNKQLA